jgi:hypothetical protein
LHTHFEHWLHIQSVFLTLAVGQIEHLPCRLPPPFFTIVGDAVCLQVTPIALMTLRVCLSAFHIQPFFLYVVLPFLLLGKSDAGIFDYSSIFAN